MLKHWGKTVSGKKSVLLERIMDEVEGTTPYCPIPRGTRARVHQLKTGRMTACKAKVGHGLVTVLVITECLW
jgi:hypothetical protein